MTQPSAAPQPQATLSAEQDNQWASFAHLGGILSFVPSLIIWLVFKDRGSHTNTEAKEALNFQIAMVIGQVAIFILNAILTFATLGFWGLIGWILPLALWVISVIFCIQGFVKAKDGGSYRYPLNIRFIK
jgi:uncharacterized Tic20 family protein